MGKSLHKSSVLDSITGMGRNKCPHCKKGNIYRHQHPFRLSGFMEMNEHCRVCGLRFIRETDFYDGASYISYGLSFTIALITFVLWWLLIGFSFYDDSIFGWLGSVILILIILHPVSMRFSRTAWLWFFDEYYFDNKSGPRIRRRRMFKRLNNMGNLSNMGKNLSRDSDWETN